MRTVSIILFLSCIFSVFSQELDGTFKEGSDSLSFSGGKVIFSVSGFGALTSRIVGEGSYEQVDDYLIVKTTDYSGRKSTTTELDASKKDTLTIKVIAFENYPIQSVLVEFLNGKSKTEKALVTDNNGKAEVPYNTKITGIRVSALGYNDIFTPVKQRKDYLVKMAENNVIEGQDVVFRLSDTDEETIHVTLLSSEFEAGRDRAKSLEKLNKKAQNTNVLGKRLKKKYIPIYGR